MQTDTPQVWSPPLARSRGDTSPRPIYTWEAYRSSCIDSCSPGLVCLYPAMAAAQRENKMKKRLGFSATTTGGIKITPTTVFCRKRSLQVQPGEQKNHESWETAGKNWLQTYLKNWHLSSGFIIHQLDPPRPTRSCSCSHIHTSRMTSQLLCFP